MKKGAEYFLRRMAFYYAGTEAEELCKEAAQRESRVLRPRELTAYHEAGHGDVGLCFGFEVAEIRLLDHPRVDGICLNKPWTPTAIELDELPDDNYQANQIFFKLRICGFLVSIPRLKRVVRRLLKKNWGHVAAVAECLLKKESRHVTKSEIEDLGAERIRNSEENYNRSVATLAAATRGAEKSGGNE